MRGKIGPLLNDERYIMAVCRTCHDWIHLNPDGARRLGYLAPMGKWNVSD